MGDKKEAFAGKKRHKITIALRVHTTEKGLARKGRKTAERGSQGGKRGEQGKRNFGRVGKMEE